MNKPFDLVRQLIGEIDNKFNAAQPKVVEDYFCFFPAERCEIRFNNVDHNVIVVLHAKIKSRHVRVLQNLAVTEYYRQLLKSRLFILSELEAENDTELYYLITIPITSQEIFQIFVDYLVEINQIIYIDETNALPLFGMVIADILNDDW